MRVLKVHGDQLNCKRSPNIFCHFGYFENEIFLSKSCCRFFLNTGSSWPLFIYFRLFKKQNNFYNKCMWKCPSSIQYKNPRPSEHESHPIITRPSAVASFGQRFGGKLVTFKSNIRSHWNDIYLRIFSSWNETSDAEVIFDWSLGYCHHRLLDLHQLCSGKAFAWPRDQRDQMARLFVDFRQFTIINICPMS